jgi:hypothetical protein
LVRLWRTLEKKNSRAALLCTDETAEIFTNIMLREKSLDLQEKINRKRKTKQRSKRYFRTRPIFVTNNTNTADYGGNTTKTNGGLIR